ncbi:MAG: hypothetical protein GVY19_05365 [Bacteroidetes bacterium]|jgi:hypothetical protein|nr:hypothetical protein [Bacteroidota bacterium]
MRKLVYLLGLIFLVNINSANADEGMWLPYLLEEGIIDSMQAMGLELDAEDIFSHDSSSLKDAIVLFGGGCTGSFISKKGLILTNHHCALSSIEKLSNDTRNLVDNGFWSQSVDYEIPVPGLSVRLLNKVVNVTDQFTGLSGELSQAEREQYTDSLARVIENNFPTDTNQYASVEEFYFGQQFYLFVYTVFNDIRLVAAPPISTGKFGLEKDNWMWPRHTGDFSIFRVYASPENRANEYHRNNRPFKPENHLAISTDGIQENDFVWVYGFPGRTNEYLPSERIKQIQQNILPNRIAIKEIKLNAIKEQTEGNHKGQNQKMIARQASLSNVLKKYKGMVEGLEEARAIEITKNRDNELKKWTDTADNASVYNGLAEDINSTYQDFYPSYMAHDYASRVFLGTDLMKLAIRFYHENMGDTAYLSDLNESVGKFLATSDMVHQVQLSKKLLKTYYNNIDEKFHPPHFSKIDSEFDGEVTSYIDFILDESLFTSEDALLNLMDMWTWRVKRKLKKDPLYQLTYDMGQTFWGHIKPSYNSYDTRIDSLQRAYFNMMKQALTNRLFYPDANRTLRLAYGQVKGYGPRDAVYYHWHTNVSGIAYKWEGGNPAYQKDEKLKKLIDNKDFGKYFTQETPVCFISNTHTTGGNSGSPALNAKGELIGLNFDRNWEGTMADYYYLPAVCRNIMVNSGYILFLLEKYGSSHYVLDELTIR